MPIAEPHVRETINPAAVVARRMSGFGDTAVSRPAAGAHFPPGAGAGGDLFCWPPGHSVAVSKNAEVILFSPQAEHCAVVEHLRKQLGG